MKDCKEIFRPLIVALLIMVIFPAIALPSGAHLNLCIGADGHTDIALDDCAADSTEHHWQEALFAGESHHEDCQDLAIGCALLDKIRPAAFEICSPKVKLTRFAFISETDNSVFTIRYQTAQTAARSLTLREGRSF